MVKSNFPVHSFHLNAKRGRQDSGEASVLHFQSGITQPFKNSVRGVDRESKRLPKAPPRSLIRRPHKLLFLDDRIQANRGARGECFTVNDVDLTLGILRCEIFKNEGAKVLTLHNEGRVFLNERLRSLGTREQRETIVEWAIIILALAAIALGLAAPDQMNPWFR